MEGLLNAGNVQVYHGSGNRLVIGASTGSEMLIILTLNLKKSAARRR